MKVYKFVFTLGLINLLLPFVGIPSVYKQYLYVAIGIVAIVYALIIRAVIKEKENGLIKEVVRTKQPTHTSEQVQTPQPTRKIEEVVDMEEKTKQITRVKAKRPAIKAVSHDRDE